MKKVEKNGGTEAASSDSLSCRGSFTIPSWLLCTIAGKKLFTFFVSLILLHGNSMKICTWFEFDWNVGPQKMKMKMKPCPAFLFLALSASDYSGHFQLESMTQKSSIQKACKDQFPLNCTFLVSKFEPFCQTKSLILQKQFDSNLPFLCHPMCYVHSSVTYPTRLGRKGQSFLPF